MRNKNAQRQHFVAPFAGGVEPAFTDFLPLAKYITEITDSSEDTILEFADYAGDGTVQSDVTGRVESWDVSGSFDATDAAQGLLSGLKRKTGADRKVWHLIIDSNGTEEVIGSATVLNIIAGSGAAEEHEEFSCTLKFDQAPVVRAHSA